MVRLSPEAMKKVMHFTNQTHTMTMKKEAKDATPQISDSETKDEIEMAFQYGEQLHQKIQAERMNLYTTQRSKRAAYGSQLGSFRVSGTGASGKNSPRQKFIRNQRQSLDQRSISTMLKNINEEYESKTRRVIHELILSKEVEQLPTQMMNLTNYWDLAKKRHSQRFRSKKGGSPQNEFMRQQTAEGNYRFFVPNQKVKKTFGQMKEAIKSKRKSTLDG